VSVFDSNILNILINGAVVWFDMICPEWEGKMAVILPPDKLHFLF